MRSSAQKAATNSFRVKGAGGATKKMRGARDRSVKRTQIATKFDECNKCIFYCARRVNAACNDCDAGENFEQKVRGLHPSSDNDFDGTDGRGDEE